MCRGTQVCRRLPPIPPCGLSPTSSGGPAIVQKTKINTSRYARCTHETCSALVVKKSFIFQIKCFDVKKTVLKTSLKTKIRWFAPASSRASPIYGTDAFGRTLLANQFCISVNDLFFVSGTKNHTNAVPSAQNTANMKKIPYMPTDFFMISGKNVRTATRPQLVMAAMLAPYGFT